MKLGAKAITHLQHERKKRRFEGCSWLSHLQMCFPEEKLRFGHEKMSRPTSSQPLSFRAR